MTASQHEHERHGGRGRGPGGPGGPAPWGASPWGRAPRRRRRERGDVRAAILLLLAEQPRHGYEILTELADRSEGQWQPSPGSIYPVLKRLAREGLVRADHEDGKRIFSLTTEGRSVVDAEAGTWGIPWQSSAQEADPAEVLWTEGRQLSAAVWQVAQLEDPEQIQSAAAVLADARKRIYTVLAQ